MGWHLVKARISAAAGVDPAGEACAALGFGASWAIVAQACGIGECEARERFSERFHDIARSSTGEFLRWRKTINGDDEPPRSSRRTDEPPR